MPIPILATKLYIPPPRPRLVPRPRLTERLNEGLQRKLTLASAPAGFGKTTLVSEWLAGCPRPTAWLSLDEGDNDPTRFLTYLVAAMQTIAPNMGDGVMSMLQAPQPPATELILTALLNEITAIPENFVLVLDDYHVIETKAVDTALTFLIEHLPPRMHLVITTREDPDFPLARLRVRNQLTELRVTDLRFTPDEAAGFLNQVMGLNLSAADIAALEARTEGWIAGLQLAALSMQGNKDTTAFIKSFTGSHHFVLDYLVAEVLEQQSESIQTFLLHTSILDQLCGSLCDAVLLDATASGQETLEYLERANLFLVPLDNERHWYRYHHLFAELLHQRLKQRRPISIADLHKRASQWYADNGSRADAIRHALIAEDFEQAANLIELSVPTLRRNRQGAMLLSLIKALPEALLYFRPVLSVQYAGALLDGGHLAEVEPRLQAAERWLEPTADQTQMVVVDTEEFRALPGSIAIYRAGSALVVGDVPATIKYAQQALELLPDDTNLGRGSAAGLLGLAYWASGKLEAAHLSYTDCTVRLQRAGHHLDSISTTITLADLRVEQGRLREAMSTYELAMQLATVQGEPVLRGAADIYIGMSELQREHNDLEAATQYLLRSKELGERTGFPPNPYRWDVAMARIKEAQGDLDGTLELLHEAERVYVKDFFPNVCPVAAIKARVWLRQGKQAEALEWVRKQGLSAHDDLSYLREFEHITLCRVLLEQYKSDHSEHFMLEAVGLLERLLQAAQEGGRMGSVIEILVLQSLACQIQGDNRAALVPLQQALTLAEKECYARIFVDEGAPMAKLLFKAASQRIMPDYTNKLLAALEPAQLIDTGELPRFTPVSPTSLSLLEPLSQRELEVLQLFRTDLTGPEIAQQLTVALSTVRTHTKNIFSKLDVNNRRAAVKRAIELGLIKP